MMTHIPFPSTMQCKARGTAARTTYVHGWSAHRACRGSSLPAEAGDSRRVAYSSIPHRIPTPAPGWRRAGRGRQRTLPRPVTDWLCLLLPRARALAVDRAAGAGLPVLVLDPSPTRARACVRACEGMQREREIRDGTTYRTCPPAAGAHGGVIAPASCIQCARPPARPPIRVRAYRIHGSVAVGVAAIY